MNANHHNSHGDDLDEARLTAYALGQLDEQERAAVEAHLAGLGPDDAERLRRTIEETRALGAHLVEASRLQAHPEASPALRAALERRLEKQEDSPMPTSKDPQVAQKPARRRPLWMTLAVTACLILIAIPVCFFIAASLTHSDYSHVVLSPKPSPSEPLGLEPTVDAAESPDEQAKAQQDKAGSAGAVERAGTREAGPRSELQEAAVKALRGSESGASPVREHALLEDTLGSVAGGTKADQGSAQGMPGMSAQSAQPTNAGIMRPGPGSGGPGPGMGMEGSAQGGVDLGGYPGGPQAGAAPATTPEGYGDSGADMDGEEMYGGGMGGMMGIGGGTGRGGSAASGSLRGYGGAPMGMGSGAPGGANMDGDMYGLGYEDESASEGESLAGYGRSGGERGRRQAAGSVTYSPDASHLATGSRDGRVPVRAGRSYHYYDSYGDEGEWRRVPATRPAPAPGTEQYDAIVENEFLPVRARPLSTFSIDVDTASYANVRRFLTQGRLPPPDAVRVEEMVNYFRYDYPPPEDETPFSVNMEVTQCPWQGRHRLLRIGLKGREVEREQRGLSNLVFLLDVSGSMSDQNKLPLVKQAMRLLVDQLTEDDRVAIVTYASSAGLKLESTCAHDKQKIVDAIDSLSAGGSTHGSAGIQLAYRQAEQHFVEEGTNRVILATDGDLNVGITDDDELVKLIRKKAKSGVFLTVLGFGTGNLKDSKMEKLADHGNGIYAYLDNLREARKVLMEQVTGSLVTIAKDVKIQIEFNPAEVEAYRLIGYENRVLAARDFDDDKKDAGEIGAGHTVTALYELVPAGIDRAVGEDGPMLKYQRVPEPPAGELTEEAQTGELLTLRLRYKDPEGKRSKLLEFVAEDPGKRFGQASPDCQFAAAVASFGMVLRGSRYAGGLTLEAVEEFAVSGLGDDPGGYRAEFVDLIRRARGLRGH